MRLINPVFSPVARQLWSATIMFIVGTWMPSFKIQKTIFLTDVNRCEFLNVKKMASKCSKNSLKYHYWIINNKTLPCFMQCCNIATLHATLHFPFLHLWFELVIWKNQWLLCDYLKFIIKLCNLSLRLKHVLAILFFISSSVSSFDYFVATRRQIFLWWTKNEKTTTKKKKKWKSAQNSKNKIDSLRFLCYFLHHWPVRNVRANVVKTEHGSSCKTEDSRTVGHNKQKQRRFVLEQEHEALLLKSFKTKIKLFIPTTLKQNKQQS